MYKELRSYGSSGKTWAAPFLAADVRLLDRVKCASLAFDPRWHAIRARVKPGATVLDAGCGMGQWGVFLTRKGYSTIGVDFATALIETLRERHPAMDWRVGRVQNLPVPTGSVDALISWGVIEHDESGPAESLREFTRVLRPGGMAFITVPVDSEAQRRSSQAQFAGPASRVFFQYFLTADELVRELEGAGFAMLESVRPVSRHHALAFPAMYVRLSKLPPLLHRAVGWLLKPILPLVPSSINMLLAVARRA